MAVHTFVTGFLPHSELLGNRLNGFTADRPVILVTAPQSFPWKCPTLSLTFRCHAHVFPPEIPLRVICQETYGFQRRKKKNTNRWFHYVNGLHTHTHKKS